MDNGQRLWLTGSALAVRKNRKLWVLCIAALLLSGLILVYFFESRFDFRPALTEPGNYVALEVQHPIQGAVMPLNMPAPALLWKTNVAGVGQWAASFKAGRRTWLFEGIQALWRPPETEWRQIKEAARGEPIELVVAGYLEGRRDQMMARGSVRFDISSEAVKYPLFYREVNLPFKEAVKDPSHIRWRFGALDKGTLPPVVLANLPVCGNCHSFDRNGEHLAMDIDYANSKGSYIITRTGPEMRLATSDIITWDDYRKEDGQKTLGLLSQISPDGRYVLSTVKDLSLFMAKPDLAFSQLFFPFMGIIAVYDREEKRFFSLPGADDPALVQSNPTWSPDSRWVVFARTQAVQLKKARDPGRILLTDEEGEEFLRQTKEYRYDLYRVPFNGGKGGKAVPLRGAAANGRSNYFPKYSPDGRWIVFCQAANYMLLQPDSELFIIPAEGGEARRLGCNLGRMNSWHSWSPDGRWLVFSSKAHSDYTQLYLTRINENGEASPPVWLAHMVDTNRAANIPEFVALPAQSMGRIREQFLDDYSYVRAGDEFYRAGDMNGAIEKYRMAVSMNSNNVAAHEFLGLVLHRLKNQKEALEHMQAAVNLDPHNAFARFNLGSALRSSGDLSNAIVQLEEAMRWLPKDGGRRYDAIEQQHGLPEDLHFNLAKAYQQAGNITNAAYHYRAAMRLAPDYPEVYFGFGTLFLRSGQLAEAEEQFTKTIQLMPEFAEAHNCLGIVRQRQNRRTEALACFQKAVQCATNNWQAHLNLAYTYLSDGSPDKAIPELRETLRINPSSEPARQALAKALGQSGPNGR